MENNTKPIEREFYYLELADLSYKRVLAQSREQHSKNLWYIPSEGCNGTVGAHLFNTLPELYKAAERSFQAQERRFKMVKANFKKIEDDLDN